LDREKHGRCANCGLQTHVERQGLFFLGTVLDPITNDTVFRGRCLACHPLNSAGNIFDPDDDEGIAIPVPIQVPFDPNADSNHLSRDKECCSCAMKNILGISVTIICAIIGAAVGVYFSLLPNPDPPTTSTTTSTITSTLILTSTSTTTISTTPTSTLAAAGDQVDLYNISTSTSTEAPPDAFEVEQVIEENVLSRGVKFAELSSNDSRNLALNWIVHDDSMHLNTTASNLKQRFILSLLAFEFGTAFRSSADWLSDDDECTWRGVSCTEDGEVSKVELRKSLCKALNTFLTALSSLTDFVSQRGRRWQEIYHQN
jgi:hypothetical protein